MTVAVLEHGLLLFLLLLCVPLIWNEIRRHRRIVGTYSGHITANNSVSGPLRGECVLSAPLDDTGRRVIIKHGELISPRSEWLSTFLDRRDGQLLIRFQGLSAAREGLEDSAMGDEYRIEFHLVRRGKKRTERDFHEVVQGSIPGSHQPFGAAPGSSGGIS